MTKHTPTPWKADGLIIMPPNPRTAIIASVYVKVSDSGESYANADFIVRACNAHDELVNAAKIVSKSWNNPVGQKMLIDAIAKAEGK